MNQPLVSIITPSFNRADIVHETAESIFDQTYPHWEWIIVDDGSTDNSWDVLQEFAMTDSRVKILKRDKEPKGACMCRNIAVDNSNGDYLIFLDTDDLLAPFCLEQRVAAMQTAPECDFIIFPMLLFKKAPYDIGLLWNIETGEDDLFRILAGDPICQGTGTLWKKASFVRIGMWNVDLKLWQDIELHIRSLISGLVYQKRMGLPPDVFLRISDISLSRTAFHSLPKLKSRMHVFYSACNSILNKSDRPDHFKGLRIMGLDIMLSIVRSAYFKEFDSFFKFCSQNKLFEEYELKLIRRYYFIRKMKLYKVNFFEKLYTQELNKSIFTKNNTIGKIPYNY